MPRYMVERTFTDGLEIPTTDDGADGVPRRRRQQRRRRGDVGALLRQRRQDEDLLHLRRPGPRGDPRGGEQQRPARRLDLRRSACSTRTSTTDRPPRRRSLAAPPNVKEIPHRSQEARRGRRRHGGRSRATGAPAASATPSDLRVIASGFAGPLHIAFGPGHSLYVADAFAGSVVKVNLRRTPPARSLTVWALAGCRRRGNGKLFVTSTLGAPGLPVPDAVSCACTRTAASR